MLPAPCECAFLRMTANTQQSSQKMMHAVISVTLRCQLIWISAKGGSVFLLASETSHPFPQTARPTAILWILELQHIAIFAKDGLASHPASARSQLVPQQWILEFQHMATFAKDMLASHPASVRSQLVPRLWTLEFQYMA